MGVKQPGRETDHSSPSSAEVKNGRTTNSTLPYFFIIKLRDDFTFFLVILIGLISTWLAGKPRFCRLLMWLLPILWSLVFQRSTLRPVLFHMFISDTSSTHS
jgi:hypothetical protein